MTLLAVFQRRRLSRRLRPPIARRATWTTWGSMRVTSSPRRSRVSSTSPRPLVTRSWCSRPRAASSVRNSQMDRKLVWIFVISYFTLREFKLKIEFRIENSDTIVQKSKSLCILLSFAVRLASDRDACHAPRGQLSVWRAACVRSRESLRELRAAQVQAEHRGRPFWAGGGLQGHYQTFIRQVN